MLLKIYPDHPNRKEIDKVIDVLRDGGLVIYPTDTLYAMGCDAFDVRAVEKICRIRGVNPQKSNLSIICSDLSSASQYARISNYAFKLMKRYLPGPFTFILPTSGELPRIYKSRKEVGIRIPDNPIVRELADALGNPLLSMSVYDRESDDEPEYLTDPELMEEKYAGQVDLVVDGGYGRTEGSTVVDGTREPFSVIRQGVGVIEL